MTTGCCRWSNRPPLDGVSKLEAGISPIAQCLSRIHGVVVLGLQGGAGPLSCEIVSLLSDILDSMMKKGIPDPCVSPVSLHSLRCIRSSTRCSISPVGQRREEMDADQKSGCLKREVWSCDDGGMDWSKVVQAPLSRYACGKLEDSALGKSSEDSASGKLEDGTYGKIIRQWLWKRIGGQHSCFWKIIKEQRSCLWKRIKGWQLQQK
ncbi:uncharacterized protein LOC112344671 isoform X1 [Selaginella moellendorffii]|uniref:uncharacterized protein LOC112344671 isoform X1 n=1 Tax=Selaginella moellendorffii TaxID=88036 RepID=UPI000D1C828B|nr:uncharacterized protein LOC112344671 isoform X1 [Selaginella moellendorffii]XP_024525682.1 uncharacterized protein LOC112344671 isoform X1 [Selaginella moellendorffii]|eukprot:XP_024525681.1 uncharacterized protein LOC112344671 isoform X1 [Selaginella moellendorffii]